MESRLFFALHVHLARDTTVSLDFENFTYGCNYTNGQCESGHGCECNY